MLGSQAYTITPSAILVLLGDVAWGDTKSLGYRGKCRSKEAKKKSILTAQCLGSHGPGLYVS